MPRWSATLLTYWLLAGASIAMLYHVRQWHRTVTVSWAIPEALMTIPGPYEVVKETPSVLVQAETEQLLATIREDAAGRGVNLLKVASQKAAAVSRRFGSLEDIARSTVLSPAPEQPGSVAALYVTRRRTPRDVETPRLHQGTDAQVTIQLINNALLSVMGNAEKIAENMTFATNTVDKLKYQLDNWEPMKHTFSVPQWNPLRVADMPRHTAERPQRYMMIGISSVKRSKDYLLCTLRSFITGLNSAERQRVQIVVLNANVPPSAHDAIAMAKMEFAREISSGLLKFVEREDGDHPHPQMKHPKSLARRWVDSLDRVKWRSKQVLDVAYLMEYCYTNHERFDYFLMMEDDIIAAQQYPTKVRAYVDSLYTRTDWTMISFYNPWDDVQDGDSLPPYKYKGVIGQVFRMHDLPVLVEFLKKNFDQSPLDWLIVDFLKKFDGHLIQHRPSVFQHIGRVSSMDKKVQEEGAVDFEGREGPEC